MSVAGLTPLRFHTPVWPTIVSAASIGVLTSVLALFVSLWLLGAAGATTFPVASDSMVPTFQRGDLVVTRPTSELRVGDIVTFRKYGQFVTHRVVAEGRVLGSFETRGDANPGNDPWTITAADVTGRVQSIVHRAGVPLLAGQSIAGRVLGANVLLLAVCGVGWALPRATRIPARVLHPSSGYAV